MAYELTNQKVQFNIGTYLENQLKVFEEVQGKDRLQKETEFQRRVADEGLDYETQLYYRENEVKRLKELAYPDNDGISFQADQIATLKKLVRVDKFKKKVDAEYQDVMMRRKSVDQYLTFLKSYKDSAVDSEVIASLDEKINNAETEKMNQENTLLTNNAKYALADKSPELLTKAISDITSKRNKLLAAGRADEASAWDLSVQQLKSSLTQLNIDKKLKNFELKVIASKNLKAKDLLDYYSSEVSSASQENTNFKVGDNTYASEKEYWQYKLNNYLTDTSNGFFSLFQAENKQKLDTAYKQLRPTLKEKINEVQSQVEELKNNNDVKPYLDQLEATATALYSYGGQLYGNKVEKDYTTKNLGTTVTENYINAVNELTKFNKTFGVDVTSSIEKIQQDLASKKQTALSQFTQDVQSATQDEDSPYYNNPEAALKGMSGSLRAYDVPTADIASRPMEDIASELILGKGKQYDVSGEMKTENQAPVTDVKASAEAERIANLTKVPKTDYLKYYKAEEIEKDKNTGAIYLKEGVPVRWKAENQQAQPQQKQEVIQPASTDNLNLRKLGPNEYSRLTQKYKVSPTNFDKYFVKQGTDIFAKPNVI